MIARVPAAFFQRTSTAPDGKATVPRPNNFSRSPVTGRVFEALAAPRLVPAQLHRLAPSTVEAYTQNTLTMLQKGAL
jgi:hypothetical protein